MAHILEILDRHPEVYLDSSVFRSGMSNYLRKDPNLSELDPRFLDGEIDNAVYFHDRVFSHPNARFILGVSNELREYAEFLGDRSSEFRVEGVDLNGRPYYSNVVANQDLIETLQDVAFDNYQLTLGRGGTEDRKSKDYQELVRFVENTFRLKKPMRKPSKVKVARLRSKGVLFSDEDQAARMMQISSSGYVPPVIVTRDRDLVRLLSVIPRELASDDLYSLNPRFREGLVENPMIIYHNGNSGNEGFQRIIPRYQVDFDFPKIFEVRGARKRIPDGFEEIVRLFIERFY